MSWATSPNSCSHIIGPNTICDPLLTSVDNILIALSHSRSRNISHITTPIRLRNTQTEPQLPPRNLRQPHLSLLPRPKATYRRTPNPIPPSQPPHRPTPPQSIKLIANNNPTPRIPLVIRYVIRQFDAACISGIEHGMNHGKPKFTVSFAHGFGDFAGDFPFLCPGGDFGVDVVADEGAERVVFGFVVEGVGVWEAELGEEGFAEGGWVGWCHCVCVCAGVLSKIY